MKYYRINPSMQKKDFGNSYPQSQDAIMNSETLYVWEDPKHFSNWLTKKIEFTPFVTHPILNKKARVTDLINCSAISLDLQISDKLKSILEKYSQGKGIQFFSSVVIHNDIAYNDYWLLHPYEFDDYYVDFEKSNIIYYQKKMEGGTTPVTISTSSFSEFTRFLEKTKSKMEIITIEKLVLLNSKIKEEFFILSYVSGGLGYFVSEKLKQEIEDAGCTGIEFQPAELSSVEWFYEGEREKIYGKS